MKLKNTASALGLYKYECNKPGNTAFSFFYSNIIEILTSWQVSPTYIGAEGIGYSGKLTKVGGRTQGRLLQSSFEHISVLLIVANPFQSDSPAYDHFISASLSYDESNQELIMSFVANEAFVPLDSLRFKEAIASLIHVSTWDFGYGFSTLLEKQPEFHILGLDTGKLSTEEYNSLCSWYATPGPARVNVLRDVYPYNILNEKQLALRVENGITLREFIERQECCSLTRISTSDLYLWMVPPAEIGSFRKVLSSSNLLLSH